MKIIILEATAEELRANKRVADAIVDALSDMCDSISRLPWSSFENTEEEETTEEEEDNENEQN